MIEAPAMVSETALWCHWLHAGSLVADTFCEALQIDAKEFARIMSDRLLGNFHVLKALQSYAARYSQAVKDSEDKTSRRISDWMNVFKVAKEANSGGPPLPISDVALNDNRALLDELAHRCFHRVRYSDDAQPCRTPVRRRSYKSLFRDARSSVKKGSFMSLDSLFSWDGGSMKRGNSDVSLERTGSVLSQSSRSLTRNMDDMPTLESGCPRPNLLSPLSQESFVARDRPNLLSPLSQESFAARDLLSEQSQEDQFPSHEEQLSQTSITSSAVRLRQQSDSPPSHTSSQ